MLLMLPVFQIFRVVLFGGTFVDLRVGAIVSILHPNKLANHFLARHPSDMSLKTVRGMIPKSQISNAHDGTDGVCFRTSTCIGVQRIL